MFYTLAAFNSVAVPNADALESLEQSIECTHKTLESQKKIRDLLFEYTTLKRRFVKETSTKAEAWQMVKISAEMNKIIEQEHLGALFALEFLEELKVFSSFARKTTVTLEEQRP